MEEVVISVVAVEIGEVVVMVVALNDIICTEIGRSSYSFIISSIIVVVHSQHHLECSSTTC